jgi:hypothetical protein
LPFLFAEKKNPNLIKSFKDGDIFKEEDEEEKEIRLLVDAFSDDMDSKASLMSSGNFTNMSCIYFTLANLSYTKQCKREDIFVSAVAQRSECDS